MVNVKLFVLIIGFFSLIKLCANIDPFSKIKITSEKAVCKKSDTDNGAFVFNYVGNVVVMLADSSKITADILEIVMDGNSIKIFNKCNHVTKKTNGKKSSDVKSNKKVSQVKKITFKGNVHISSKNRQAFSDRAEIDLPKDTCRIDGNVKIIQNKTSKKNDLPLIVRSTRAILNLKTSEVVLLGNSTEPVSTIVELGRGFMPSKKRLAKNEQD